MKYTRIEDRTNKAKAIIRNVSRIELISPYIVEFVGTFLLVLCIGLNVGMGSVYAPFAIGSALMGIVYFGGHISGSHYNPAVTLAVFLSSPNSKINVDEAFKFTIYVMCQLIGALFAGLIACGLVDGQIDPHPGELYNTFEAFLAEFLFTFFLIIVVLNVTTKATTGNSYFGLAIGFTVLVGAITVGPISGGVFNPAVGSGLILANGMVNGGTIKYLWIYWLSELLAAGLATFIFRITNTREYVEEVLHYDFSKEESQI